MELSDGKIRSQLKLLDNAGRAVLAGVFGKKLPADLMLADFYRDNRQCGSRDRALIGTGVYALLRFWGMARKMIPEDRRTCIEQGEIRLAASELAALFYTGFFCENPDAQALEALNAAFGFGKMKHPGATPEERAAQAAAAFGLETAFSWRDMMPDWMVEAGEGRMDEAYARRLMRRPPVWVRIVSEPEKVLAEFRKNNLRFTVFPGGERSVAIYNPRINFREYATFQEGCFEIQDLASQGIGLFAAARPGERWLDACAGAGGKTLLLASQMEGKGTLIAGDVRERALTELRLRARRAGFSNIQTRVHDGGLWRGFSPCDGVLLDAPCSGSGVWRRNPGLMWVLDRSCMESHCRVQTEIMEHFSGAVKPGGVLVYSTCSLFPEENERQVAAFLERHPDFFLDPAPDPLTGKSSCGMVNFESADSDSMFAARMRRRG